MTSEVVDDVATSCGTGLGKLTRVVSGGHLPPSEVIMSRQEMQASRLIGLAVLILLRHHPFAGKEEEFPQIMELFAFVKLRMDTPA